MPDEPQPPTVFVSYAWGSEEHNEWVIMLATRLRQDGVNVILDQWDLREGQDKYVFMEQMVTNESVQKVIAICNKRYSEKADGREGGVGTESQIISKQLYEQVKQEKFIPIIRERDDQGKECVPVFFRGRVYIDFSDDDAFEASYERLLRNIYGKPDRVKPELGKPPSHILAESAPVVRPAVHFKRLKYAVEHNKPYIQAILQEYLEEFIADFELFRVKGDPQSPEFDEAVVQAITNFTPYRDSFIDMIAFVASYLDTEETWDTIIDCFEQMAAYQQPPESMQSYFEHSFDGYRFILHELFLSTIAVLLRSKRFTAAAKLIDHPYIVAKRLGGSDNYEYGLSAFCEENHTIDVLRNKRLRLNRIHLSSDLLLERATHPKVTKQDLMQADMLLFIRYWFPSRSSSSCWRPRLVGFAYRSGVFELFSRATTDRGMSALRSLLHVQGLPDLATALQSMFGDPSFQRILWSDSLRHLQIEELLNWRNIAQAAGIRLDQ